jgi:hypothetical protein
MSKPTKTGLALSKFKTLEQRHQWKRAMIDAELCSKIVVKAPQRDNKSRGTTNYTTTSNSATPSAE